MTSPLIRIGAVAALSLAITALTVGGGAIGVREPRPAAPVEPDGRTVTVCPPAPSVGIASATTWGTLAVRALSDDQLRTVSTGRGHTIADQTAPLLVVAEGRQPQNSAVSAYARETAGPNRGLALARCATPTTSAWFTGLLSSPASQPSIRSEVILVNPDSGQAEVDLRLFGPAGLQIASGSRGIAVPARSVRSVALDTLFTRAEPVGLEVRTTGGRIAPVIRQYAGLGAQPVGNDWQVATTSPATVQVVPAIPGGPGPRTLVLTNPGIRRTTATVEVLGTGGTFAPVDAGSVDVNAESTAAVALTRGLAGEPAAVRVTADQPVIAGMSARSADAGPDADLAFQSATQPISGTALGAVAAVPGAGGSVLISNAGAEQVVLPLRLVDPDGAQLAATELIIPAGITATWEVGQVERPASVQIQAPTGSTLYAGVVLTSATDPTGGLATAALSIPQQSTRGAGAEPVHDTRVAQ